MDTYSHSIVKSKALVSMAFIVHIKSMASIELILYGTSSEAILSAEPPCMQ